MNLTQSQHYLKAFITFFPSVMCFFTTKVNSYHFVLTERKKSIPVVKGIMKKLLRYKEENKIAS